MEIDPKVWGRHFWFVLHTISFTFPQNPNDTAKRKYYDLIQNLPLFIPNQKIANQFASLLDKYPVKPYLDSRGMFVKWMHFVHNEINVILGKEKLSYQHFLDMMNTKLSAPPPPPKYILSDKNVISLICVVFFGGIVY